MNLEVDRVMNQPQGVAPNALADELVVNENHGKDAHIRSHGLNWAVDRLSLSFLHDHLVGGVDIGQVTNSTERRLHAAVIVNQSTLAIVPVNEARIHVEECNSACLGLIIGEGDAVLHLGSLDELLPPHAIEVTEIHWLSCLAFILGNLSTGLACHLGSHF